MGDAVHIVGIGMMTPVGDSAAMTAASVRAGISAYGESSVHNRRFQPMTLVLTPEDALPPLHEDLEGVVGLTSRQIRMLRLAQNPLAEATSAAPEGITAPLLLAGPEQIRECPKPLGASFLENFHVQCEQGFDRQKSRLFLRGRASGIEALESAYRLLVDDDEPLVLVGGLDTYLDLYLLATLDMDDRVLADGIMNGFAPGEGAAFLLLASSRATQQHALDPLAELCLPALGEEPGHRYSEEAYKGDGLAEAVTGALAPLEGEQVQTVFATLNGENFYAKEWGVTTTRNHALFADELRTEHPADSYGDPGAAAGPLMVGLAAVGLKQGYTEGPCLVYCSSETEGRGAVCVRKRSI